MTQNQAQQQQKTDHSQRIRNVIKFCRILSVAPFAFAPHCSLIIYLINDIYAKQLLLFAL